MGFGRWHGENWLLAVRVQPRSSRAKIVGMHGELLKIALTSPPVDGAANTDLCQLIAKELGVAKGKVGIIRGEKAREKHLCVRSISKSAVEEFCARYGLGEK
ncbi:MAG: DUF167 domain-containing protein [Magnetococcales bacterium]|nr:DUF167 domain-containing protein [Magnetococcales bacterium]